MEKLAGFLLGHKARVLSAALVLALVCGVLSLAVNVSYDLTSYLPDQAPSTRALEALAESSGQGVPNLSVYVPCASVPQALDYKARLQAAEGVYSVLWLDDTVDLRQPLELLDPDQVSAWYVPGEGALFLVTVKDRDYEDTIAGIREIIGPDGALSGEAADFNYIQSVSMDEISNIMLYAVPLILVVLLFATSSWLEPVLFLLVIGIAILFNSGTNLFLGEISYVTQACSAILQLAVSMDYAIFLLHAFARHRQTTPDVTQAMKKAIVEAAPAIAASMVTTLFGFLSLCLMKFKLGADMGVVLAKGVLLSYVAVVGLLPILAIYAHKLLEKTRHRDFLPGFGGFAKGVMKLRIPVICLVLVLIVPCFMASRSNRFIYGSSGFYAENSPVMAEKEYIQSVFGDSQQVLLLVPQGDEASELAMCRELEDLDTVTSVVGYATYVGAQIPQDVLDGPQLSQLRSGGFSRIILYTGAGDEGPEAFALVEAARAIAQRYYGDSAHLVGRCGVNYDLMNTVTGDNLTITLAAIVSIGLVLLLTFRSLTLPLILLLTIEGAIWINLSIPYFAGSNLNFIGYQIISSVQLGATVDYGILLTQHYLTGRLDWGLDKTRAVHDAVATAAPSVLTPALIIFVACQILGMVSTNGVISQMGHILGRGALISVAMVLLFLPGMLYLLDGAIRRTTWRRKKAEKQAVSPVSDTGSKAD